MHKPANSYATKYNSSAWNSYYQLYIGMHPEIMWFHILLAKNKIIPLFSFTDTSHYAAISSQGLWKFKVMHGARDVLENCCVTAWFNLTLTSTIRGASKNLGEWFPEQL